MRLYSRASSFLLIVALTVLIGVGSWLQDVQKRQDRSSVSDSTTTADVDSRTSTQESPGSEAGVEVGTESIDASSPNKFGDSRPAKPAGGRMVGAGNLNENAEGTTPEGVITGSESFNDSTNDKSTEIANVLAGRDLSDPAERAWAVARLSEIQEAQREAVLAKASRLGIPLRMRGPGHRVSELYTFQGDRPVYRHTTNANAAISSGANLLFGGNFSLSGSGVKVGVWDGGSVRSTHQELTGRVTLKNASAALDDHATHVAGTIGASGVQAAAKGMAPSVAIDSYEWTDDYTEMTAAGASSAGQITTKIPLSNHSYGYDAVTADMGRYETEARSVDAVAAALPYYLPFWAAGNEQDTLTAKGGFQSITYNGLAKNIMTVGAANDAVTSGLRDPAKAVIASFSSLGPCDDGRIKPDLVANGVNVYSSISTGNAAYDGTYSGTSMATPSAMGSAALIVQLYAREFSGQLMRASTLKALLIHTASDRGNPGPDYTYGWGLINVKAAADLVLAHKASLASPKIIENSLSSSQTTRNHTFTWDGSSPIRATLSWTDPAGTAQTSQDSRTPNLVRNLDLKVTAPNGTTVYRPYIMPFVNTWTQASMSLNATTGVNNTDNVEQVLVASPSQAGTYTLTVSINGTLTTNQTYSLIVTGGSAAAANPAPNVTLTSPASGTTLLSGNPVVLSANATDTTSTGATGTISQVQFLSGNSVVNTDTAAPYTFSWTPPSAGTYTLSARATDSEGASASSSVATLTVLSGNGAPTLASFSPTSGSVGTSVVITGTNFSGVTAVRFNGVDATSFTSDSSTQITAVYPSGAGTGPVTVINAYGTGTSPGNFTLAAAPVLISQVYGAGGLSGAVLSADYVELRNTTGSPVSLANWSVQYASASGTTWSVNNLSGSIPAYGFYLLKLASGTTGAALPTADATGGTNLSASSGKIALRNSITGFTGSSPIGQAGLQDFVGYGTANAFEGAAAAPAASSTTAILRAGNGVTDSGNNNSDFSSGSPNPRNSSGGTVAPVITSASTAGGSVGSLFSYQITASNGPTSYSASPLPAGLTVNGTTGAISGTPTTAGTTNTTLSATNSGGTGTAALTITIVASGGGGGGGNSTIFNEDFTSITSGNSTSTAGSNTTWAGNGNFTTTNNAFQAGGAVRIGSSSANGSITSRVIDLSGNGGNFTLSFKVKGWTDYEGNLLINITGQTTQSVSYTNLMTDPFETKSLNFTGGQASSTITFSTPTKRLFLDDVLVTRAAASGPVITTNGTLSTVNTTYGTASPTPSTFTLSGDNLAAGVLVTAPAGFEVSKTAGGASGYNGTQTVGAAGTLAATPIYVRLASTTAAGSYDGNILCTSPGALPVNVATAPSVVYPKLLTVTANDRTKAFGTTLSLGTSAFTTNGTVGAETVGTVTLSASGGTGAYDAQGDYEIIPSNASGGTFNPANYDISYETGLLTVTGQSFASWLNGLYTGNNALPDADPDFNGLSNALEFFYGMSPGNNSSAARPILTVNASQMSLQYRRSKSAAGVTGTVVWSNEPGSSGTWSSEGITDNLVSDEGTYEIREAVLSLQPTDIKKFLRFDIVLP